MVQPRWIVHAGFPKCGSTTIQVSLAEDKKKLENEGIKQFCIADREFESQMVAYLEGKNKSLSIELGFSLRREISRSWEAAIEDSATSFVMSSELILFYFEKFVNLLPDGVEIEIVVIVRSLDSWLQSEFLQQLKSLHVKSEKSLDNFIKVWCKSGKCDHKRFIQQVEKHPKVKKVHVLPLISKNRKSLVARFYQEVLKLNKNPIENGVQNQVLSLDQLIILRTIREISRSKLVGRDNEKSFLFRLGQLVASQKCGPPMRRYIRSVNRNSMQPKCREYSKWILSKYSVNLIDSDPEKLNSIDFDRCNRISLYGFRFLVSAIVQAWIEVQNIEEREYELNFDIETTIFNRIVRVTNSRKLAMLKNDFCILDEFLEILSACGSKEVFGSDRRSKNPSRRMQEIARCYFRSFDTTQSKSIPELTDFSEGVLVESLKYFLAAAAQVAWEMVNVKEREWEVLFSTREFALANDMTTSLAKKS